MAVSKKIKQFMEQGSWIRRMFEEGIALKRQYGEENVFDLSLGNPIMQPPPEFYDELRRIANDPPPGLHRYMPNAGHVETRAAIADELTSETALPFTADDVLMTVGAGGALNVVLHTLLDPGDEVVIFAPYFVEYFFYADNHGATCKVVPADENFLPDLDALADAIGPKTRIVLTSSPNNPTGVVYGREVIAEMGRVIRKREAELGTEVFLVSDEPYRKILFDGLEYPSHLQAPRTQCRGHVALQGPRPPRRAHRVHRRAIPEYSDKEELIDGLTFCNRTLGFVNAPALMQHIVKNLQSVTVDVSTYEAQRDFMYGALTDIGYQVVKPQGAFYMFPKAPIDDDVKFTDMLRENRVLVVPGTGFGGPGHFRISYCVSDATLEGSLPGFRAAFEGAG